MFVVDFLREAAAWGPRVLRLAMETVSNALFVLGADIRIISKVCSSDWDTVLNKPGKVGQCVYVRDFGRKVSSKGKGAKERKSRV